MPRFPSVARNDGYEVTGLPRFPSVARNDEKRGKARLRVGTSMRFLSGSWKGVGTRVRFLSGGRKGVGTRVRFFAGSRKEVGTRVRFLSGGWQEVGTRVRFLSGSWQGVGTGVKSKKLLFIPSSPMREQEIIIFSVLLAEGQSGLPRFARNDGRRNVDCSSGFGRLQ